MGGLLPPATCRQDQGDDGDQDGDHSQGDAHVPGGVRLVLGLAQVVLRGLRLVIVVARLPSVQVRQVVPQVLDLGIHVGPELGHVALDVVEAFLNRIEPAQYQLRVRDGGDVLLQLREVALEVLQGGLEGTVGILQI